MPYRYRAPTRHNRGGGEEKKKNYHWGIGLPAIPGVGEIVYSPFMFGVFGGTVRTAMYTDITANDNNPILQLRHQQHRFRRTRLIGILKKGRREIQDAAASHGNQVSHLRLRYNASSFSDD